MHCSPLSGGSPLSSWTKLNASLLSIGRKQTYLAASFLSMSLSFLTISMSSVVLEDEVKILQNFTGVIPFPNTFSLDLLDTRSTGITGACAREIVCAASNDAPLP